MKKICAFRACVARVDSFPRAPTDKRFSLSLESLVCIRKVEPKSGCLRLLRNEQLHSARCMCPIPIPHPTPPHLAAPHLTAPQLGEAWLIFIPRPRPFHPPATAHRSLALSLSRSLSGRRSYTHLNGHTRSYSSNGLVLPYLRPRCRIICYCQNYCGEVLRKSCRHRRENYRCSFSVLGLAASFFSRNFFFLSVRLGENRIYC
jgi:hypothetical protein